MLFRAKLVFFGAATLLNTFVMADLFTPSDLIQLPRPGAPVTSPSGALAVYAQSAYNITDDKTVRSLYLLNVESNTVEELTKPSYDVSDSDPFFLDDKRIAYFHHHADSEVDQLYVLDLSDRDAPYQLTDFPIDFGNVKYNSKQQLLAFSAAVYPDKNTLEGTLEKDKFIKENKKDTAMVYDELMVRHWDDFVHEKKNNIFVVNLAIDDKKYKVASEPINLLKDTKLISPGFPLGDASDYDISPNGEQIAFLSKITTRDNAWQTSAHIYLVPTNGKSEPVAINSDIPAASSGPHFTSSGLLTYLQMYVPKYEADRNRITVYNPETEERKIIAESWDYSPGSIVSSPDAKTLYVTAEEQGRSKIFSIDIDTEDIKTLTTDNYVSSVSVLPSGNLLYGSSSMQHPVAPYLLDVSTNDIKALAIEKGLEDKLKSIEFSQPEDIRFIGAKDEEVHGWYLKPAQFEEGKKYPVAFLIHGGPQGAWGDSWSTRWNPQVYTGAGYAVVAINFHGSTGYGQAFTDSIGKNWGNYPFHDLEIGLDYVLDKFDYLDRDRVAGLGASYGGYMVNWLNGHSKKFKVLVNHDGVFSTTQVYYTTDELYFAEKEFGGSPINPEDREGFEKWSPSNFVQNWSTPTLLIHGGRDFRLTTCESLSAFTALQKRGIPSRFVYFPDENHWVLKAANSVRWHKEVLGWINKYTNEESSTVSRTEQTPPLIYQNVNGI